MTTKFIDACVFNISNAPGSSDGFTFSTKRSGAFLAPVEAGIVDQGLYRLFIYEPSSGALEIRTQCRWNQATQTFTRGKLRRSSTGSPISFTASAVVSVTEFDSVDYAIVDQGARAAAMSTNLWASSKIESLKAVAKSMVEHLDLLPPPPPVELKRATGATRWLDPTWGGPFNGTFAQPYATLAQATLAPGDQLLIKQGTTLSLINAWVPNAGGNADNRVILGVYDPATGERLVGVFAAATITCSDAIGAAIILTAGRNYFCIDGLRITTSGATNTFGVVDTSDATHLEITNCELTGGGFCGLRIYGAGHVVQGCRIHGNAGDGIFIFNNDNRFASAVIQYNWVYNNGQNGVYAFDYLGQGKFSGTIACNYLDNNGGTVVGRGGISLLNGGGAVLIYRNHVSRSPSCIAVSGFAPTSVDFSGTRVENNDVTNAGEFGILYAAARAPTGRVLIQANRIRETGTYDGTTQVTNTDYARAIETFGIDVARAPADVLIRCNYISRAICWIADGTEGVGIGIDNNTRSFEVCGNYVELCEGNGIQVNQGLVGRVYSNILVDNVCAPVSRGAVFTANYISASQIHYIGTPHLEVFNNTIVYTGLVAAPLQQLGIGEKQLILSPGAKVYNNVIVGAALAGVSRSQLANATTESNNRVIGSPNLVVNSETLIAIAAGSGTAAANDSAFDPLSELWAPNPGGAFDGTGAMPPAGAFSFSGRPLADHTPIGALHAA